MSFGSLLSHKNVTHHFYISVLFFSLSLTLGNNNNETFAFSWNRNVAKCDFYVIYFVIYIPHKQKYSSNKSLTDYYYKQ